MILVERLRVGQLDANCYLVYHKISRSCLIIDPGDSVDYITQKIIDLDLKPKMILATHGHFDHVLAVSELKINFDIPFMMSKKDEFLLSRMRETSNYFTNTDPLLTPTVDEYLNPNNIMNIENFNFEVIDSKGHTPGSVSLYFRDDEKLFVGDLVFEGGAVGRVDFKYASESDLLQSIRHICNLPSETIVYSGHGGVTTINEIKQFFT